MLLLLFLSVLFLALFYEFHWKRRNYPAGPLPLPVIGNMWSMMRNNSGVECFRQWTKDFGDVYTFWFGTKPYIVVSSYKRLKEAFILDGDTFADKIRQPFQDQFRGGNYGVVDTNGHVWSTHRRFALSSFRDFGLGKNLLQEKMLIEVQDMFAKFDANLGKEQNLPVVLYNAAANVINQLIFGYRFDKEREGELKKLKALMEFQETAFTTFKVYVQFFAPAIGKHLPGKSVEDLLAEFTVDFYKFFNHQIEEHRSKIDFDSEESLDYAEAYLKEQRKQEAQGEFELFSTKQLSNTCFDLWFAGLSTTHITLTWIVGHVLNYPDVQRKLHKELDEVIGSDRLITNDDKNNLPYLNAVINESQRCANIVPINQIHSTSRDTVINGITVKKGTGVIPQISAIMLDDKVFPDPYAFNPERFLDANGKLRKI
ncbi:CYtochrome P450 family [Caenorhabditis elegans]|uniref:CYtochrome P450 family n=1 Tax=Caenorhabditis elegans TaxID=6239 RepID=Q9N4Q4_CAEEL|nr:CYtochrome P450 family [Caenorhabditis elegans]CCD67437.1 CYtochrome P450 family [Caenorhabditis elegans]|eukprot:NP_503599.1 CYtochrome P450 family [Caenorhabditis elegans]